MSSQEVFRLHSAQAQHLRNLVKRQSLVAIALQSEASAHRKTLFSVASQNPPGALVRDAQRDFHC